MKNSTYWANRFKALEDRQYRKSAAFVEGLKAKFDYADDELETSLYKWYSKLMKNTDAPSLNDAKKLLKENELKEFHWTLEQYEKYAKEHGLDPEWIKKLENASARKHISRYEQIQLQMRQIEEKLYAEYNNECYGYLGELVEDSYYHTAYEIEKGTGIGIDLHKLDRDTVEKYLTHPWCQDGKVFSDRIWQRKDELVRTLDQELTRQLITGADPQKAIDAISDKFDVSKRQAGTLVMTESAAIASEASKDSMKNLGVEEYEILATLDSHTSEICQEMDGQHFRMSEYNPGLTAPPFHPNCRSTTVPYFDDEFTADETRAARDAADEGYKRVPADMKYGEWKEKYIDEKPVEKSEKDDTIKLEEQGRIGIMKDLSDIDKMKGNDDIQKFAEQLADNLNIDRTRIPVEVIPLGYNGNSPVDTSRADISQVCHFDALQLKKDDPRSMEHRIKTAFHESYHVSLDGYEWDALDKKGMLISSWADLEDTFAESSAHYLTQEYGIGKKLAPAYSDKLVRNLPRLKQLEEFKECNTIQDFGRVAFEKRKKGQNGVLKDLIKRMKQVELPKGYQSQYFDYIRENKDELYKMIDESMPGIIRSKETYINRMEEMMKFVENTGMTPSTDGPYFEFLACAMQMIGVK